jgi:hypothetical protein
MAKSLKQHKISIKGFVARSEGNFAAVPLPPLKKIFIIIQCFSGRRECTGFCFSQFIKLILYRCVPIS